jgi:hypothetical protein
MRFAADYSETLEVFFLPPTDGISGHLYVSRYTDLIGINSENHGIKGEIISHFRWERHARACLNVYSICHLPLEAEARLNNI